MKAPIHIFRHKTRRKRFVSYLIPAWNHNDFSILNLMTALLIGSVIVYQFIEFMNNQTALLGKSK